MPDIFDEVSEDLRADRARAMLRRYGVVLAGLLVATLVAVGAYDLWDKRATEQASAAASRLIAAQKQAAQLANSLSAHHEAPPALAQDFANVAATGPGGYKVLAALQLAALDWDQGRQAQAIAGWSRVASDGDAPQILRDLARLSSAEHQVDTGDANALKAQLLPLVQGQSPFRPMAEHVTALLDYKLGRKPQAVQIWKTLTTDPLAPPTVRQMAQDLLVTLGEDGAGPRG